MKKYRLRLNESIETDIISLYKELDTAYEAFKEACRALDTAASDIKNISLDTSYLSDFCENEVYDKMKIVKDSILDEYYPIDYADDEDDPFAAGDRYRSSKEAREQVFD